MADADALRELTTAGRARRAARRAERAATARARAATVAAEAAGMSEVQIAATLGASRETVRRWLGK